MVQSTKKHGIETIVSLLAPEQVGIKLVPVQDVQRIQHTTFWTSMFLGISTAIFGALISLHASDYVNQPVMTILWLFLVVFVCLLVAFSVRTYNANQIIENTKFHTSPDQPTGIEERDEGPYVRTLVEVFKLFLAIFDGEKHLLKDELLAGLGEQNPSSTIKQREDLINALIGVEILVEKDGSFFLTNKASDN